MRKFLSLPLWLMLALFVSAQSKITREKMVNARLNDKNELVITPSGTSSAKDFDYLTGKWKMKHRKLKTRLNNCTEWLEFETTDENYGSILNGIGNMDILRASFDGKPFEGLTLRLFNPQTKLWSLYWVPSDKGVIDPPVVGSFDGNVGHFYGKDVYNGVPVIFVFRWDKTNPNRPEWSQAFSTDNGETWEWNWWNISFREEDKYKDPVAKTFMPGIISSDSADFGSAYSPDGNSFYFSRSINKKTKIFVSHNKGGTWQTPEIVSFSNTNYSDADPAFAPNGDLYFISSRPRHANDSTKDYDIWKVIQKGGKWSEPVNVKELNSDKDEYYISFAKNGNVYFASSRAGGYGEEDIYYSVYKSGKLSTPKNLGPGINTPNSEYDPFVTSDESTIIFTSSGRKDSYGRADLYWSVNKNGEWVNTLHFDDAINTSSRDYCPYISRDGKQFFYSSMGDIKSMPVESIAPALKRGNR